MRRTCGASLLAVAVVLSAPGSAPGFPHERAPIPAAGPRVVLTPAPVPATDVEVPVVVDARLPATAGWSAGRAAGPVADLDAELLSAYSFAVAVAPRGCHLTWSLLAAIGQVESGNAAGHRIDASHRVVPAIIGPVLDGTTTAAVPDTDDGALDGDRTWDRAVGPFQLLPSSWRVAGVDFDHDGVRDPQDVYDSAGAAMVYLCAGGRDLDDPQQLRAAVLSYNHSVRYLRSVLAHKAAFDRSGPWGTTPEPPAATVLARAHLDPAVSASTAHAATASHHGSTPVTAPGVPPAGAPAAGPGAAAGPKEPPGSGDPTAPAGPADPGVPACPTEPPADPPAETPADPPAETPAEPGADASSDDPSGIPEAPVDVPSALPLELPAEVPPAPDPCGAVTEPATEPATAPVTEPGSGDPAAPTPTPVDPAVKPEA